MPDLTITVVAKVGDPVRLLDLECKGWVRGIRLTILGIDYLVSWYHNGQRYESYVTAREIEPVR